MPPPYRQVLCSYYSSVIYLFSCLGVTLPYRLLYMRAKLRHKIILFYTAAIFTSNAYRRNMPVSIFAHTVYVRSASHSYVRVLIFHSYARTYYIERMAAYRRKKTFH